MRTTSPTNRTWGLLLVTAIACGGCALSATYIRPDVARQAAPGPRPEDVDASLLLIGDAGMSDAGRADPVLRALSTEAAILPQRTTVVFLGDNIYPHGLPPAGDGGRARAESRLRAQVEAATSSGAEVLFIPGNHDYAE